MSPNNRAYLGDRASVDRSQQFSWDQVIAYNTTPTLGQTRSRLFGREEIRALGEREQVSLTG